MTLLEAIEAAAEAQAKLDKLTSADANLSVKGAVAEAQRQGGVDKEADKVISEMESGSPDGVLLRGAFTRLCLCVRNFARTSILKPDRMTSYLGSGGIEALSRMQVSRASMMLATVRYLTANEPELWGTADSPTAWS